MKTGTLYLLPNTLGGKPDRVISEKAKEVALTLDHFIIEEIRSARRLLRAIGFTRDFEEVSFEFLNEHNKETDFDTMLQPAFAGKDIGLLSEAGAPCLADPGSDAVRAAHRMGIRVVPLAGASAILLTLIGSGLNGQNFAFTGYLPKDRDERTKRMRQLEQIALSQNQTQLFMDAPYRNDQVVHDLVAHLRTETLLCIACELTCENEMIKTMSIGEWKKKIPSLNKKPTMFAIGK